LAKSASKASNKGSPIPTGMLSTTHSTIPPRLSPAFLAAIIASSIFSAHAKSGHRVAAMLRFLRISGEVNHLSDLILPIAAV